MGEMFVDQRISEIDCIHMNERLFPLTRRKFAAHQNESCGFIVFILHAVMNKTN